MVFVSLSDNIRVVCLTLYAILVVQIIARASTFDVCCRMGNKYVYYCSVCAHNKKAFGLIPSVCTKSDLNNDGWRKQKIHIKCTLAGYFFFFFAFLLMMARRRFLCFSCCHYGRRMARGDIKPPRRNRRLHRWHTIMSFSFLWLFDFFYFIFSYSQLALFVGDNIEERKKLIWRRRREKKPVDVVFI